LRCLYITSNYRWIESNPDTSNFLETSLIRSRGVYFLSNHSDQIQTWKLIIRWIFSVKCIYLWTKSFDLHVQFIYDLISTQSSDSIMSDSLYVWRSFINMLFLHTTGAACSKYWWKNKCVIPKKILHHFWKTSKLFPQTDKSFNIALDKSRIDLLLYSFMTSLVAWWSELLTTNNEVPGSIPGSTMCVFPWKGKKPMVTMVWVVGRN